MDTEERRQGERVIYQKPVLFGREKPPRHWAYITDISDEGIFIKTGTVFPAGTRIYVTIKDYEGSDHDIVGEVMRTKKIPPALYEEGRSGMGVRLIEYEKDFLDSYRRSLEMSRGETSRK